MVLNIISDAAVHSQAAAFSRSSSQTELKCSESVANVRALSWPAAPPALPFSGVYLFPAVDTATL